MFYTLLIILHIFSSLLLILLVLMQSSKGEGLSGAFGMGSGTTSLFGADTATVLTKGTVVLAVIFSVTSLSLALWQAHSGKSQIDFEDKLGQPPQQEASAVADTGDTAAQYAVDVEDTSNIPFE